MRYRPSTRFDNTGGDGVSDLPSITWVVTDIRRTDGMCPVEVSDPFSASNLCISNGHELVEHFTYEDGRFDPLEREFLGFARVFRIKRNDQGGVRYDNSEETEFMQTSALRGKMLRHAIYAGNPLTTGSATVLVAETEDFWTTPLNGVGGQFVRRWLQRARRYDQSVTAPYEQFTIFAFDQYGNTTKTESTESGQPTSIATYIEYTTPIATSKIYDRPWHVYSEYRTAPYPSVPTKTSDKLFYYDDVAPGAVSKGNVTHVESMVQTGQSVHSYTVYDDLGNVTLVTNERGAILTSVYDSRQLYALSHTNHLGHASQTTTDYRWGKPLSVTDPNGATTTYVYDDAGRPRCIFRPFDTVDSCPVGGSATASEWYEYEYPNPAVGQLDSRVTVHRKEPNQASGYLPMVEHFDALLRHRYAEETRTVDCQDEAPTTVITGDTEYDAGGRVYRVYHPYAAPVGTPTNGMTEKSYQLNGHATLVDPLNRLYRVTGADGSIVTTTYDRAVTTTRDKAGIKSTATVDIYGRTARTEVYDATDALYAWTDVTYDGAGRVLSTRMNDNENTRKSNIYDLLGRKLQTTDPDSGTWTFQYDSAGNVIFENDPRPNHSVEYCYDMLNRPTKKFFRTGTAPTAGICSSVGDIAYSYDAFGSGATGNKGKGLLTHVRDLSGETDYSYDLRGRTTSVEQTLYPHPADMRNTTAVSSWEYDAADRVSATHYPSGETVTTEYDTTGQPRQLLTSATESIVDAVCFDLFGRPNRLEHSNGVVDTHTYAGNTGNAQAHRLSAIKVDCTTSASACGAGGETYLDLGYPAYDARGLLSSLTDTTPRPAVLSNQLTTISYDHLGRVTGASGPNVNDVYEYDALGNIKTKGTRYFTPSVTKPHQIASATVQSGCSSINETVEYDENGNRTKRASQTYQYDHENRLTQIDAGGSTIQVAYDFSGRQVLRAVQGAVTTRYYGDLAETSTDGYTMQFYYLAGMRVASRRTPDNSWEVAGIAPGIRLAQAPMASPHLAVQLTPSVQMGAVGVIIALVVPLTCAPWARRRVHGKGVRSGHALGMAIAVGAASLPWAIVFVPAPVSATVTPLRHWHLDHLGSTQVITDETGAIVEQIRYKPYGEVRGHWSAANMDVGAPTGYRREFTGYETEPASGLQYAGARFYDPAYGTFLTHDPAGQFASPYTYTNWNPLNVTDPSGAIAVFDDFVVFAIALIAANAISSAVQAGIASGDVGVAFKALGISLGVAAATWGLGSIISTVATGIAPALATSVQIASIGSSVYGIYRGAAEGDYASAAIGAVGLAVALAFAASSLKASSGGPASQPGVAQTSCGSLCEDPNDLSSFPERPVTGTNHRSVKTGGTLMSVTFQTGTSWATDALGNMAEFDTYTFGSNLDLGEVSSLSGDGHTDAFQVYELAGMAEATGFTGGTNHAVIAFELNKGATYTGYTSYGGVNIGIAPISVYRTIDYWVPVRFIPRPLPTI